MLTYFMGWAVFFYAHDSIFFGDSNVTDID